MEACPIPKRVSFFTSGYHPARFIEEVDEYFYCPICSWVVRTPVACGECEALYCRSCHDRVASLREDICLRCNSPFRPSTVRIYPRQVYSRYHLFCSYLPSGCPFSSSLQDMQDHEAACHYRPVDCENPWCCNQFRLMDRLFEDKLVCSQRCWDCHELLSLYQNQSGYTQCLDFFMTCVAKHREKLRVSLPQQFRDRLETANSALDKEKRLIEHLQIKLNSLRKQIANS